MKAKFKSCFTGNKFLIDSLQSSRTLEEKRLILDEAIIKDMMAKRKISEVKLTDTRSQLLQQGNISPEH